MARYIIQGEWKDTIPSKEIIDVTNPAIDNAHIYRSVYTYANKQFGDHTYEQDVCLNRYELNNAIIERAIQKSMLSKLWTIDPKFVTFEQAIKLAKLGQGMYMSERLQRIWEMTVIRYAAGERNLSIDHHHTDKRLREEAYEASLDLDAYAFEVLSNYDGYVRQDKEKYEIEEERALDADIQRLEDNEDFCLDLMKDIIVTKRKVMEIKNNKAV